MRRRISLALLPLMLAGTATHAAAAGGAGPDRVEQPGMTIHRVSPVVRYSPVSEDPDGRLDAGLVRVAYTCTPGGDWPREVYLQVTLRAAGMDFGSGRFGDPVPCDEKRHTVAVEVSRGDGPPFAPPAERVPGEVTVVTTTCLTCTDGIVTADTAPVRVHFTGTWPDPAQL